MNHEQKSLPVVAWVRIGVADNGGGHNVRMQAERPGDSWFPVTYLAEAQSQIDVAEAAVDAYRDEAAKARAERDATRKDAERSEDALKRLSRDWMGVQNERDAALRLVADIRAAVGDDGKRMQPELVEYLRGMHADVTRLREALQPFAKLAHQELSWVSVTYMLKDDPEEQRLVRNQMQRAFNNARAALAATGEPT